MPDAFTAFAAQHLVTADIVLATLVLAGLLYSRRHARVVCWTFYSGFVLVSSLILFRVGDMVYIDPRPFVVGHYQPLVAHTANNGFPSGLAILAAIIVSSVMFLNRRWSIPFVIMALLIDWARMSAGLHHPLDIIGSWVFVGIASAIALFISPVVTALVLPRIPNRWTAERFRLMPRTVR